MKTFTISPTRPWTKTIDTWIETTTNEPVISSEETTELIDQTTMTVKTEDKDLCEVTTTTHTSYNYKETVITKTVINLTITAYEKTVNFAANPDGHLHFTMTPHVVLWEDFDEEVTYSEQVRWFSETLVDSHTESAIDNSTEPQ
jgi:hypothetical protein